MPPAIEDTDTAAGPPPSDDDPTTQVGETAVVSEAGEEGKLRTIMNLLKRCMSVKDIANIRLSLPASLMYPAPNLEYWNYIGRADTFVEINSHDDPIERMLAVIRFTFAKDLRFIRGGIVKPYNSVLGEHFRCSWVAAPAPRNDKGEYAPETHLVEGSGALSSTASSRPASVKSGKSGKSGKSVKSSKAAASTSQVDLAGTGADADENEEIEPGSNKIVFLTEQISHHPPVSAFWYSAPDAGVEAYGVDQVGARVSGTSIRVFPGERNNGIFVNLPQRKEEYQISHPIAAVSGLLRGSIYASISDSTCITIRGEGAEQPPLRAIIEYKEESWLGRARFAIEGVVYRCKAGSEEESWTKVKQVPKDAVVVTLDGSWRKKVNYKLATEKEARTLLDLDVLDLTPKRVRPLDSQDPLESRRIWGPVTSALLKKDYGTATKEKQTIEQRQRDKAAERKKTGEEFQSRFFELETPDGRPVLTEAGKKALEEEHNAVAP